MRFHYSLISAFIMAYIATLFQATQISTNNFFDQYIENTTRIEIYDNKEAYFYLNNTHAKHFLVIPNNTNFEALLEKSNYLY